MLFSSLWAQSYEKSRAEQKILIFFMPRRSKFALFDGKVTKIMVILPIFRKSLCHFDEM